VTGNPTAGQPVPGAGVAGDPALQAATEAAALTVAGVRQAALVMSRRMRRTRSGSSAGTTVAGAATSTGPDAAARPDPPTTEPTTEPLATTSPATGRPTSVLARPERPLADVSGGPAELPATAPRTLTEALLRAAAAGDDRGTTFIADDGESAQYQGYRELLHDSARLLRGLRAAGLRPGDAALFQFDSNRNYVTAFWACVLGGFLPTPVGFAPSYQRHNAVNRKLFNAWQLLDQPPILTDRANAGVVAGVRGLWERPDVSVLAVEELGAGGEDTDWYDARPDDPVLHLLTSGSTGIPKCVRHTHRSVVARTYAAAAACGYGEADRTVNWMPLDHVSIVMYNVRDVFLRCDHVNAKIGTFLADPLRWLDWIDTYRGTNTWAPNFAYAMVNERHAEVARRDWDLSCMRAMTNAAEPVVPRTAHRFLELMRPHRLPPDAMKPCWGMSETCSGVTYTALSADDPSVGTVSVAKSSLGGDLVAVPADDPDAIVFTDVGRAIPGLRMRIVGDDGAVLPEDRIGALQVTGSVMMREYYRNPEANASSFTADDWFDTGDLAFLHHGSLVITGRAKDLIIVNGANVVAHEIEALVEQVDGVEVTYVAAVAVPDPRRGSDGVVVFFVPTGPVASRPTLGPDLGPDLAVLARTMTAVRLRVAGDIGIQPLAVVPVTRDEFPKTGSGKIQRGILGADFRKGVFDERLRVLTEPADDEPAPEGAVPDWFFDRTWVPSPLPETASAPADGTWLLFAEAETAAALRPALATATDRLVVVRPGASYQKESDGYGVDPVDPDHYRRVIDEVGPVSVVVHAWAADPSGAGARDADATEAADPTQRRRTLDRTAFSLLALARALDGRGADTAVLVLTTHGVYADEKDRVDHAKGTVPSLVRTAAAEAAFGRTVHIDLPVDAISRWSSIIHAELAAPSGETSVAYREGRLVPRLRPVPLSGEEPADLPSGGRYLITGGLGGIGAELAEYLAGAYGARLLVLGRRPAAPGTEVADRVADLAILGDVRYAQVDVADAEAVQAAVADAERDWGAPLDVVLHLAGEGIADHWADLDRHRLARASADEFRRMYRAKIEGAWALETLLADRPELRMLLFSSVNGEFGGAAFGGYSSANGYLHAFTDHWAHQRGRQVRCLAWSMWSELGMSRGASTAMITSAGYRAIDVEAGLSSFLAATASRRPYLVVGLDPTNPAVLRHIDPAQLEAAELVLAYAADGPVVEEELARAVAAVLPAGTAPVRLVGLPELPADEHGRPDRSRLRDLVAATPRRREHAAPRGPVEQRLAGIFGQVLGRTTVGRQDTFFELGGGSLQAAQVVAKINIELAATLAVRHLYENPSVAALAQVLEQVLEQAG
jgi:acyl-CoA synthetase (AMP-forming)/AMP-acid ligase II/NAD(P)-dependent dehydrogenase (short-subunit alcohol dehydrogenase family)